MSSEDIRSIGRQLRQIEDPRTRSLFERIIQNQDIIKESIATLEGPEQIGWIDLNLQNGYTETGSTTYLPQYFKNSDNIVFLRGSITPGTRTDGTVVAQLPIGFRPSLIDFFALAEGSGQTGRLVILPNGDITVEGIVGGTGNVSIHGYFHAEL